MDDARFRSEPDGTPPPTPRWVKLSIGVAIAFVVAFAVLHLTGSGMGMHRRHQPALHDTAAGSAQP